MSPVSDRACPAEFAVSCFQLVALMALGSLYNTRRDLFFIDNSLNRCTVYSR